MTLRVFKVFILITILILSALTFSFAPPKYSYSLGPLSPSSKYPIGVYLESCVTSSNYVYCVGGTDATNSDTEKVYYASLSSAGIGPWLNTTSYPEPVSPASCVGANGYVYCIGGAPSGVNYYAKLSSGGVGKWFKTSTYPGSNIGLSCFAMFQSDVYCVGGCENETYYAPITSSGIGAWSQGSSYPIPVGFPSCAVDSVYVYCVGGRIINSTGGLLALNSSYYASISLSGIGPWINGTSYPVDVFEQQCFSFSMYVYCLGGSYPGSYQTYEPNVSSAGIGQWVSDWPYAAEVYGTSCFTLGNYLYCVGGILGGYISNDTYFSYIDAISSTKVHCFPTIINQNAQFYCAASVTGTNPSGTVYWSTNASSYNSQHFCVLSVGSCNATLAIHTSGNYTITANYAGDANNAPSSGSYAVQIIHLEPNTSIYTETINLSSSSYSSTNSNSTNTSTANHRSQGNPYLFSEIGAAAVAVAVAGIAIYLRKYKK